YTFFPWDRLADVLMAQAEQRAGVQVDLVGFGPSYGTGVTADSITIHVKPQPGEKEETTYELSDVSARISLLSLLRGDYKVSFAGDLLGGHVEGSFVQGSGNQKSLEASIEGLELAQITLLKTYAGLPVFGKLSGDVSLDIPAKGVRGASGNVDLRIDDGKIGEKGAKLGASGPKTPGYDQSITLEEGAKLGTFSCKVDIDNGKGTIKEFAATNGEIEGSLEGTISLRDRLPTSILSGVLKFRFDEAYVDRSGMKLYLTAPALAQAKTDDGWFAF